jgi:hypothetical protein
LVVGDCRGKKPVFFQIDSTPDSLESFEKIIEKYPKSNFKIILGSDVSYTVSWPQTDSIPNRSLIKTELAKYIPEDFEDNQFDWKLDKQKNVEAIVATGTLFKTLTTMSSKYPNIRFETQSSMSLLQEMGESNLAKETGGEIFLYAASKGASSGSDQSVLDLDIGRSTSPSTILSKKTLHLILAIIIVTLSSILILNMIIPKSNTPQTTTPLATPTPTPSVAPTKDIGSYKVSVQNGTKIDGLASTTKESLLSLGFTQVSTENYSTGSATTKVILKEALPEEIQQKIIAILTNKLPDISLSTVDINISDNDIVILLGEK